MPIAADSTPLQGVPATLRIPLAARAFGDEMFPAMAVHDRSAAAAMAAIGDAGTDWLADRASVFGVLARTQAFRMLALSFFARHPRGTGVDLGCGLADYFQWLDQGRNRWVDADLPEVMAIRRHVMSSTAPHQRLAAVDLRQPGWWAALQLPEHHRSFLMCEGVLMYFKPEEVHAFFDEVCRHAAPGTELVFDAMCWMAVGRASRHALVRQTSAEFLWGPRRLSDITDAHPKLRLDLEQPVMDSYSVAYDWFGSALRWLTGAPMYSVTRWVVA